MIRRAAAQQRLFPEHAFDSRPTFTSHGYPETTMQRPFGNRGTAQDEHLRMLMQPHEILRTHGPSDGDRAWTGESDMTPTRSPRDTQGYDRMEWGEYDGNGEGNFVQHSTDGGTPLFTRFNNKVESDQEIWDRKYTEATGRVGGSIENPSGRNQTHRTSLVEHMAAGSFPGTVTLGTLPNMNAQRTIAGGHHRVAVAARNHPNMYLPVEHVDGGPNEAQASSGKKGYRYT